MDRPKEPAAVWVDRSSLKPWAKNPRKNDDAARKVADSIKRFGFGSPILARRADGEVIAGHTRLKAAEMLGLDKVPVRYLDLDPADAHLLALADNKIGEVAEWDTPQLQALLSEFSLEDVDLAGWDSKALDEMAAEILGDSENDEPDTGPQLGALTYQVVVTCRDEDHQGALLEKLEAEGLQCRPLIL